MSESRQYNNAPVTESEVIARLEEMSKLLEVTGANPFKIRAFFNAARALESLPEDLESMMESKEILDIPGIGKGIYGHIDEMLKTGTFTEFEEVKKSVPQGVLDMMRIPGIGPKKVKALFEKLNLKSIPELEAAIAADAVAELPGFGKKTQENITKGIERMRRFDKRHLVHDAMNAAQPFVDLLSKHKDVERFLLGGSLRRRRETIKDIDILVSAKEYYDIMDDFTGMPQVERVIVKGATKSSVILREGINVDLRVVQDDEFAFASHYFTGSKQHNTELRGRAKKLGYKLNEYGLFKGEESTPCKDEAELFKVLGLDYIEPELREATGEIEAAEQHELPELITEADIQGTLHCHTTYSDGSATLREMADAARKLGLKYLGIADHSKSAGYAGGLKVEAVKEQAAEIAQINEELAGEFRIFHGTESDILKDGSLDYPDDVLASFDYVVASIHGVLNMDEKQMTERMVKAIENPFTTMIGHPTGRILETREGYPVDVHALIDAAVANDVMLEINAHPSRLDLDWRVMRGARDKGMMTAINPDAHSTKGLAHIKWGVGVARKAWLRKSDVLNTRSTEEVADYFSTRKQNR